MILFGCLLAMGAAVAPRLVLILAWIFSDRWAKVWEGDFLLPVLGIILLPYTTIMYVLVWSPVGGVSGWDWVWVALGVVLDLMKWGLIGNNRRQIPGYDGLGIESAPAAEEPADTPAKAPKLDELARLGALRDQGVISHGEVEAKRQPLEAL